MGGSNLLTHWFCSFKSMEPKSFSGSKMGSYWIVFSGRFDEPLVRPAPSPSLSGQELGIFFSVDSNPELGLLESYLNPKLMPLWARFVLLKSLKHSKYGWGNWCLRSLALHLYFGISRIPISLLTRCEGNLVSGYIWYYHVLIFPVIFTFNRSSQHWMQAHRFLHHLSPWR
jgi:hypothetical protein